MSDFTGLMRALLGPASDASEALAALDQAFEAESDPLRWCAMRLDLSETEIMRRAASWAGLAYFEFVPRLASVSLDPVRLEALADVRMFRMHVLDRDIAFAAPDFFGMVRLKQAREDNPELRKLVCIVPDSALRHFLAQAAAPALVDRARQGLARSWPFAAAQLDLTGPVRVAFCGALLVLVGLLISAPFSGQYWLMPIWAAFIALPSLLRLAALFEPLPRPRPLSLRFEAAELPIYSVLVPLRDEANMVEQLCNAIQRINYPADRLDVLVVVEQRSARTVEAVRQRLGDIRFTLVEVPDAMPRTKPKALDFALPLCRGEFVVVYDAEDRPDPDQLRKAVAQFRAEPDIECVQARLVIANGHRHPLAALFAGEYASLFAVMLRPSPDGTCWCRWEGHPTISDCRHCGNWADGTHSMSPKTPTLACACCGVG